MGIAGGNSHEFGQRGRGMEFGPPMRSPGNDSGIGLQRNGVATAARHGNDAGKARRTIALALRIIPTPQRSPVRLRMQVGAHRPAHAGASSKALMAFLPPRSRPSSQTAACPGLGTNTITDPAELLKRPGQDRGAGLRSQPGGDRPGAMGRGDADPGSARSGRLPQSGLAGPVSAMARTKSTMGAAMPKRRR